MSTPVLLVMDFQTSIVDRLGSPEVLAAATRAVDAARTSGVPVVFVRVAFRAGFPEIAASNKSFGAMRQRGDAAGFDERSTAIHAAFAVRPDEVVVTKRRVSAFTGSDLDVVLRAAGATELVLAGIATSGVVLSTLRQAADLDYGITVLADACADADPEIHRVLTEKVYPRQADVTTVDAWVANLRG
ncbi:cysteine hydrolase family protein [Curtobacterium sp. MCBD17_019]|uniref:cysteine hydrolase family protein n=1 Tax=Curtobacterium sp. MCBD17_019 TaxID=2175669 RepID=UPI000DA90610|nr:isochorismatase family cysteine hydrolase [Curtobacterium sp. MCBD17_019]PZE76619.1 cysteine hydrolase [Curtobacterium sp. MCBD17_019]